MLKIRCLDKFTNEEVLDRMYREDCDESKEKNSADRAHVETSWDFAQVYFRV